VEALECRTVPSYLFQTLDDPNAGTGAFQGTGPQAINEHGQITGFYTDVNNVNHGFLLSNGQYTTLDDPNAGTGAGQGTIANVSSDSGQIVGSFFDANTVAHGFVLSGGQYTTLPDDPKAATGLGPLSGSDARAMNDQGQIVGFYYDANFVSHGYLLSHGQYTTLDDPNAGTMAGQGPFAQGTFPQGFNNSGQIVGFYIDASFHGHGYLLSHGQYTTLDDPNAANGAFQGTIASGINDHGQIVGYYYDANNVTHGYLLSHGQYTTIDAPKAGTGAFQGTGLQGINDSGHIVGFNVDANNVIHGFLATPGGSGRSAVGAGVGVVDPGGDEVERGVAIDHVGIIPT
jgi:probable HAF family extracellular repeat protein